MWQSSVAAVYEGGQQGLLRSNGASAATAGLANPEVVTGNSGWDLGNSGMISQIVNRQPPR